MSRFYRYAKWADKQTDDYNEPMLYNMAKMLVFQVVPMLLMIVALMIVAVILGAVLFQVVPWIWDVVWI